MKIKDADGGGGRDNDGKSKINDLQLWFTSIVSFNSALTKAKMGGWWCYKDILKHRKYLIL